MLSTVFKNAPNRIKQLPTDHRGFPVPWFVHWENGEPDFRVIGEGKISTAIRKNLCWVCGEKMGRYMTFAVGPMCGINRTSAEPPCHRECAEFSATACPFLTQPKMRRNETGLPDDMQAPAGTMLKRNPGVTLLWTTRSYKVFSANGGQLIEIGDPANVDFYCKRRPATRAEVLDSIESGYPALQEIAEQHGELYELAKARHKFMNLIPTEGQENDTK